MVTGCGVMCVTSAVDLHLTGSVQNVAKRVNSLIQTIGVCVAMAQRCRQSVKRADKQKITALVKVLRRNYTRDTRRRGGCFFWSRCVLGAFTGKFCYIISFQINFFPSLFCGSTTAEIPNLCSKLSTYYEQIRPFFQIT